MQSGSQLVGREDEQAGLDALLAEARRGRGGVLTLVGEPGVGKTALCRYVLGRAEGFRLVAAAGIESESELPFSGLSELLRPLETRIAEIPEFQAAALAGALALGPPAGGDRFAVYAATLSLLAAAAAEQPLLAVIDDAHWLDPASSEALLFAARRLSTDRAAIVLALRDGQQGGFQPADLPIIRLKGLSDAAAGALLERTASGPVDPDVAERVLAAAGGNPLAVEELATSLSPAQCDGTDALDDPMPVGTALENAFLGRLEGLPGDTRTALLVAAASEQGDGPTVTRALKALGVGSDAFGKAVGAGLVEMSDGQVRFRHPLVRSAVYHRAEDDRRRAAHRALANALEDQPERRAWHLATSTLGPDEVAAEALEDAAEGARSRGFRYWA